jgi:hypothetical protein
MIICLFQIKKEGQELIDQIENQIMIIDHFKN